MCQLLPCGRCWDGRYLCLSYTCFRTLFVQYIPKVTIPMHNVQLDRATLPRPQSASQYAVYTQRLLGTALCVLHWPTSLIVHGCSLLCLSYCIAPHQAELYMYIEDPRSDLLCQDCLLCASTHSLAVAFQLQSSNPFPCITSASSQDEL